MNGGHHRPAVTPGPGAVKDIVVSAVVMRDAEGHVLNVRKRGTRMLMLPGGKPEAGEAPAETALREFREELGIALDPVALRPVGSFRAAAANEPDHEVVAHVFEHPYVAGVAVNAEIELLEWVDPAVVRDDMAPLNTEHVFPALLAGRGDGPARAQPR
ncbi:NUDIX domain-containing protein [Leucobacter soli]|uniref:NUDIX hydrolase n=1 Tax=Leucobacter soli TaxID=2812850 RepID=UPI0022A70B09|nr:NUDIX domain-containing protein [Leucobacter soli]